MAKKNIRHVDDSPQHETPPTGLSVGLYVLWYEAGIVGNPAFLLLHRAKRLEKALLDNSTAKVRILAT